MEIVAFLLLLSTPGVPPTPSPELSPTPPPEISEAYRGRRVAKVELLAPRDASQRTLRQFVEVHEGDALEGRSVRRSLELLEKLGQFSEVEAWVTEDGPDVDVTFRLVRPPELRHIVVRGNTAISDRRIVKAINRARGSAVEEGDAEQISFDVRDAYRRLGYLNAKVEVRVVRPEPRSSDVDVVVDVTEGPLFTVASISCPGCDLPMPPTDVFAAMKLEVGKPFRPQVFDEDKQRLIAFFRERQYLEVKVRTALAIPQGDSVRILFRIEPGEQIQVRFEGHFPPARGRSAVRTIIDDWTSFRESKLRQVLDLENETQFTRAFAEEGVDRLRQYYQEEGYYEAQVEYELPPVDPVENTKRIVFKFKPGQRYRLDPRDIHFVGNVAFRKSELRLEYLDGSPTVIAKGGYSAAAAELSRLRVENYYKSRGFLTARVGRDPESGRPVSPDITLDKKHRRLKLTVHVEEGPRTLVESVRFTGNETISSDDLLKVVAPIGSGSAPRPLDAWLLIEKEKAVKEAFANAGRPDAVVTAKWYPGEEDPNLVDVVFTISEGPLVHFGKVITAQTKNTAPDVVRDQITIRPGDPWNEARIDRTRRKLQRLGVFDRVAVGPFVEGEQIEAAHPTGGATLRDVRVVLMESNRIVVEPSVGVSSEKGPRIVLRADHRNVLGRAHKLSLRAEFNLRWEGLVNSDGSFRTASQLGETLSFWRRGGDGNLEQRLLATYTLPTLFDSPWVGSLTGVFREASQKRTYGVRRDQLAILLSRDIGPNWHFAGSYHIGLREIIDKGYMPINGLYDGDEAGVLRRLAAVSSDVLLDRRDDRFNPTRGWFARTGIALGHKNLGSEFSYVRFTGGVTTYTPIPQTRRVYLIVGGRGGWATPLADTQGIPVDLRFHVGGANSLRGFAEESVGPEENDAINPCPPAGSTGDEVKCDGASGGDVFGAYTVELRFPLPLDIGGAVFHDAGNTWLLNSQATDLVTNPAHLAASVGVGLRFATPVGPAKVDYAVPVGDLDRFGDPGGIWRDLRADRTFPGRLHITIGDF